MSGPANQVTLGVVGHVDHGKTALVRALTGIETDRLREEQERGLSIVLGFSWLESHRGTIDLIDVPGHEDFIRTMISGATGIDGIVLVVAANEGVMPQTREHFDIAELLGVECGVIVLTKTDLVSADELALAEAEVRDYLAGSFLEAAPLVHASVLRGDGKEALHGEVKQSPRGQGETTLRGAGVAASRGAGMEALRAALGNIPARGRAGRDAADEGFCLPVDRVFGMRGFGVVVTGTLRAGVLRHGADVEVLPGGAAAGVRGLQIHRRAVDAAFPGQRVAVNLRHGKHAAPSRGDVLATPGLLQPARRIDVRLRLLGHAGERLGNGAAVRVLFGATEAIAKVRLLEARALAAGEAGLAQLRFRRDVVARPGERFIVRGLTPVVTLGGGCMLEVGAPRRRRFDPGVIARLGSAARGDTVAMVRAGLEEAGLRGVRGAALGQRLGLAGAEVEKAARAAGAVELAGGRWLDASAHVRLLDVVRTAVEQFHRRHPRRQGLAMASIPTRMRADLHEAALQHAVDELEARGELRNEGSILSRTDFDPLADLGSDERRAAREIEAVFRTGGLMPPPVDSVLRGDRLRDGVLRLLTDTGALVRLKTYDRKRHLVMHRDVLRDVRRRLGERFPYPAGFTVADVRDLLGATRKYIVPLMEHLDGSGVTIRSGNVRRLRER